MDQACDIAADTEPDTAQSGAASQGHDANAWVLGTWLPGPP
jgi:hypothetical protein